MQIAADKEHAVLSTEHTNFLEAELKSVITHVENAAEIVAILDAHQPIPDAMSGHTTVLPSSTPDVGIFSGPGRMSDLSSPEWRSAPQTAHTSTSTAGDHQTTGEANNDNIVPLDLPGIGPGVGPTAVFAPNTEFAERMSGIAARGIQMYPECKQPPSPKRDGTL